MINGKNTTTVMLPRHSQIVSTKSQQNVVIEWMMNEVSQSLSAKEISLKAVDRFPSVFKFINARTRKCCIQKAYRWYNGRHAFLIALQTVKTNKWSFQARIHLVLQRDVWESKLSLDVAKSAELGWNICIPYCCLNLSDKAQLVCKSVGR